MCLTVAILAGAALFVFKPFTAEAATHTEHDSTWEYPYYKFPTTTGKYILGSGMKALNTYEVSGSVDVCMNGNRLTYFIEDITCPLVSVKSGGTLNINSCGASGTMEAKGYSALIIQSGGSAAIGGETTVTTNGSEAIYSSGTLTINSGTVTSTGTNSYAVYIENGTFNISGDPTLTGKKADIYLASGKFITVTGELTGTDKYSVFMDKPGVFTNTASGNLSLNDPTKFTSAVDGYSVIKNSKGQLELSSGYTVTFDPNGGTLSDTSKKYGFTAVYSELPIPTRTNYKFDGWYTSKTGGKKVNAEDPVSEDITLYAHWLEEYEKNGTPSVTLTYGTGGTLDMKNYIRTAATKSSISNGDFKFSITNTIGATIVSNTGVITIPANVNVGSHTLTVEAAEDTIPSDFTFSVNVTVNKAVPTVTAPTPLNIVYDGESHNLLTAPGSSPSGGEIQYSLDNVSYSTVIPEKEEANEAGYTVWYKALGDSNYTESTPASVTAYIRKADSQVVKPPEPLDRSYDGTGQPLVNAGSGTGGTMVYCVDNQGGTYSEELPTESRAGTYTVWYMMQGDKNHNNTLPQSVQVKISAGGAVFGSAPVANNRTYDGTPQPLLSYGGEADGGTMMYSIDGLSYSNIIPTAADADTYYVWYMVKGDESHDDIYAPEPITVVIAKADSEVTIPPVGAVGLVFSEDTEHDLIANESEVRFIGGDLKYSTDNEEYADNAPRRTDAGEYTVWYKVVGDSNHNDTSPVSVTVTIEQADTPDSAYAIPQGLAAVVGWTMSDVELPHGFSWKDPSRIIDEPTGPRVFDGIYTPDDRNYKAVEIQIPVTVEKAPDARINYFDETLVTASGVEYSLSPEARAGWMPCPANMPLETIGWDGSEEIPVYVRNSESITGAYSTIIIPARPDAPDTDKMRVLKSETSITVLNTEEYEGCEFAVNDESGWQANAFFSGLTPGQDCTVYVYLKATAVSFRSDSASRNVITVREDGSTELRPGETVETGNGGTVTNNGDDITITDEDGNTTTVTPPEPGDVGVDTEGNVVVPEGSVIDPPGNKPEMVLPDGGVVDSDGNVTLPDGGRIEIGDNVINVPAGGRAEPNEDGTVNLPEGTVAQKGGNAPDTAPEGGGTYDPSTGKFVRTDTEGQDGGTSGNPGGGTHYADGGNDFPSRGETAANADSNPGYEEDISAEAGLHEVNELLEDTAPVIAIIAPVCLFLLFIRKRSKAHK